MSKTKEKKCPPPVTYRILFCGDASVGKSSIINKLKLDNFSYGMPPTVGVDFSFIDRKIENELVRFKLVDIPGQHKYSEITNQEFKKVDGIVLVYDKYQQQSFDNIKNWIQRIEQNIDITGFPIILVGNKNDKIEQNPVSKDDGLKVADEYYMNFFETSALNGDKINLSFQTLCHKIYMIKKQQTSIKDNKLLESIISEKDLIDSINGQTKKKQSCFQKIKSFFQ